MASPRPSPGAAPAESVAQHSDTREQLIAAALRLMGEQPWERVPARAVALAAGLDPALVTYHFGGRSGLVVAVAERATAQLRAQMHLAYDQEDITLDTFRSAVMDAADVMLEQPLHAQLYVDELLLHGDEQTDRMLHTLAGPYFASIQQLVEHARRQGMLRHVPDELVVDLLTCLSLVYIFLSAALRRHLGAAHTLDEAGPFLDEVITLTLLGSAIGATGGLDSSPGPTGFDDVDEDPLDKQDIVATAIEMLRKRNDAELTPATVAVRLGRDTRAVLREFATRADLLDAVARAATSMLSPETPKRRPRGRPRSENPEVRADLLRAAADLISRERKGVTARAVATAAGCDPALVTYYFGSRRGLLQALAEQTVADLHSTLLDGLAVDGNPLRRLRSTVEEVVRHVATRPGLAHVLLDEFLIHGTSATDEMVRAVVAPGLDLLRSTVDEAVAAGLLRSAPRAALLFQVVLLPVFVVTVAPIIGRALGGPALPDTTDEFVDGVVEAVFGGIVRPEG